MAFLPMIFGVKFRRKIIGSRYLLARGAGGERPASFLHGLSASIGHGFIMPLMPSMRLAVISID